MALFFSVLAHRPGRKCDFSPLPWSQYFETMEDVEVDNDNSKDISFMSKYVLYVLMSLQCGILTFILTFRQRASDVKIYFCTILHSISCLKVQCILLNISVLSIKLEMLSKSH